MKRIGMMGIRGTLLGIAMFLSFCTLSQCQKIKCPENGTNVQDSANSRIALTDMDLLVLSGTKDAYSECYNRSWGRGQWPQLSQREFILYCYIFAIRDSNIYAAQECSTLILKEMHDKEIPIDTSLLRFAEHSFRKIEQDQSLDSSHMRKFIAASSLAEIYSGSLYGGFRDTVQYLHYKEAIKKYAACQRRLNGK